MKTHAFNLRNYDISIGPRYGDCDPPNRIKPTLTIGVENEKSLKFLEVAIHESLHSCNWKASEELVTITAKDISRFLWRLGYRKS